jgi:acyl-CoA synthetase (AMP-forming)/AMP-acid ligase II
MANFRYMGFPVAPTELEGVLQTHPAVQECLVFGKRDDRVQGPILRSSALA